MNKELWVDCNPLVFNMGSDEPYKWNWRCLFGHKWIIYGCNYGMYEMFRQCRRCNKVRYPKR
jgi:hypothetical protein